MAFRGNATGSSIRERKTGEKDKGVEKGCRWCGMNDVTEDEEHVIEECKALKQQRGDWVKEVDAVKGKQWRRGRTEAMSAMMRELKGLNAKGWTEKKGGGMGETEKAEMASRRYLAAIEMALRKKTGDELMGEVQGQFGSEDAWMRRQMDLDMDEVVSLIVKECEEDDL